MKKICNIHKTYQAIYPPRCSCFDCWVGYVDKKIEEKNGVFNHHEMLSYHKAVLHKILDIEEKVKKKLDK